MNNIEEVIQYSQHLKLLYVEDNSEARESTIIILEEFFDDIIIAVDGKDGYEKFENNNIDIIITDINMPKLSGLEMTKKIREIDKSVPILVLSAYNESSYFMDSIRLGIEGYLLKPIDMDQFIYTLDKVIEKLKLIDNAQINLHFLKEYEDVTNESSIVSKTDLKGIITYVNDKFCKISEYTQSELIGQPHNVIRHPDMLKETFFEMWDTIKNQKKVWKGIVKNLSKTGKSYYVDTTIKPILNKDGDVVEYIGLRNDITAIMNPKKQLNDAIKNIKDPLVIYMKLEEFKTLEEFYDNSIVEQIEDQVAVCIENNISIVYDFDKVYQLGYGEYAIVSEKSICMEDKEGFIKKIEIFQKVISDYTIDIGDVDYDISIIISLAYEDKQVLESAKLGIRELLDTKQNFIVSSELAQKENNKAMENIKTISMIKKALSEYKIISHFQPIINNRTKKIEKYESLVRLINEEGEILSPFFFLETAKKGKYYSQITNIVLDNSFGALKNTDMDISINLSALDIELENTRDKLFELLKQNKQYASRIIIELLEDESVKNFKVIKNFINDVKSLGVKIAIDDFGAGYSNFERLLDYKPDILKIDGCLIRDIETNSYSLSVVKTIVAFAKEQNIQTVAEFVENEEIFNILNNLGVDYSQGYYFSAPKALEQHARKN